MPYHTHLKWHLKIWHLSAGKKSTSSFTFSLSYFFIAKILWTCFGYFGHARLCTQKWYYQFIENFCDYLQVRNQFHPPCFSEDWVSAFWHITWEPEFFQIWDWWWNINNNISFPFRLFLRKTNDKIFQKVLKKLFRGQFGSFLLKLGQNCFLWKRGFCLFLNIPFIFSAT